VLDANTYERHGKTIIPNTRDSYHARTNGITQGGHDILWPGYMWAIAQVVLIDQLRSIYIYIHRLPQLTLWKRKLCRSAEIDSNIFSHFMSSEMYWICNPRRLSEMVGSRGSR